MRETGLIEEHLSEALFNPIHEFLSRPRKTYRSQLVQLGFELGAAAPPGPEQTELIRRASQALESLHAAALIMDDIRDESTTRRGHPALHLQIGAALAANTADWLSSFSYRLIYESDANAILKNTLITEMTESDLKAHQGHALNLSIRMSQQRITEAPTLCRQSMEWTGGALLEMGLVLGACIAGCEGPRLQSLRMLGRELGVSLQMFAELARLENLGPKTKHLESLAQQRPSFIWWLIAEEFPEQWGAFKEAVLALPQTDTLRFLFDLHPILEQGQNRARMHQQKTFQNFATLGGDLTSESFQKIEDMASGFADLAA
jgi:geranylgeranyl pyrophosphate synthase